MSIENVSPEVPQAVEVATKRGPGRPPLPPEERERRRTEQRERYSLKLTARRRALAILQERHVDEFEELLASEEAKIQASL